MRYQATLAIIRLQWVLQQEETHIARLEDGRFRCHRALLGVAARWWARGMVRGRSPGTARTMWAKSGRPSGPGSGFHKHDCKESPHHGTGGQGTKIAVEGGPDKPTRLTHILDRPPSDRPFRFNGPAAANLSASPWQHRWATLGPRRCGAVGLPLSVNRGGRDTAKEAGLCKRRRRARGCPRVHCDPISGWLRGGLKRPDGTRWRSAAHLPLGDVDGQRWHLPAHLAVMRRGCFFYLWILRS
jgi:hypothetical protein